MINPRHIWMRLLVLFEAYVITSIGTIFLLLVSHGIHPSELGFAWIWYALLTGTCPVLVAVSGDLPLAMSFLLITPLLIPFLLGICYVRERGKEGHVWLLMYTGSWFLICGIIGFGYLQAGGGLL